MRSAEHVTDLLESFAFCFGQENGDENNGEKRTASVEHVNSRHSEDFVHRGESAHDEEGAAEIERSGDRAQFVAVLERKELAHQQMWHGSESQGIGDDEHHEAEQGDPAEVLHAGSSRNDRFVVLKNLVPSTCVFHVQIRGQSAERYGHETGRKHEQPATTEPVNLNR